jgi:hypothetical protein
MVAARPHLPTLGRMGGGKLPYESMAGRRRPRVSFYTSSMPNLNDPSEYGVCMVRDRLWSSASTAPDCSKSVDENGLFNGPHESVLARY